jgi:prepilin-type N-terminal cleavage/methylation domain-containing protein
MSPYKQNIRSGNDMKQKNSLPANWRGFTLLELLVAAGVISFLSVIITQILFSSIHLNTKTEVIKELKQTGEMTLGAISRMIQNASTITCNASTYITITGQDGGITTLECIVDADGITRIASVSATRPDPSYLTSGNVTLIDTNGNSGCTNIPLQFTCVGIGGVPNSISVSFRLRQKNLAATSYESAVETFQTTISVRNATNE